MNALQALAFRRIPSFRREDGGLYGAYSALYSRAYGTRMAWRHRGAGPAPDMTPLLPLEDYADLVEGRTRNLQSHCRLRRGHCAWCGGGKREIGGEW